VFVELVAAMGVMLRGEPHRDYSRPVEVAQSHEHQRGERRRVGDTLKVKANITFKDEDRMK